MQIRRAGPEEAAIVTQHRRAMFHDMGRRDAAALDAMAARFLPWVTERVRTEEYLAWFAVDGDGTVAAGLGLWLMDWPPHLVGSGSRRGNILNVYTHSEYRRRGLARRLMEEALAWCRTNGIDCVILHASEEGRALYEALGFRPTNEMRMVLEPPH